MSPDAEQLGLFGGSTPFPPVEPRTARRGDRGGATEAAKVPDKPEKYLEMLRVIVAAGNRGCTDSELATSYFPLINSGTISKRRLRLDRAGLIEWGTCEDGLHHMRLTQDGVPAMVFVATDKGREVLASWD